MSHLSPRLPLPLFPVLATFLTSLSPIAPGLMAQGPLTPPGAPLASMRTLSEIEPRTRLESLTGDSAALYVINTPGSYYISAGNVAGLNGKAAIAVNANGVSIDLNGFSLIGTGGSTRGIEIRGASSNLAIRNGGIRSWGAAGIGLSTANAPTGVVLENLTIATVGGAGIDLTGGNAVTVSRCSITGAAAGILIGSTSGTVHACAVSNLAAGGATSHGILAGSVTDCDVNSLTGSSAGDCYGILARTVQGCSVTGVDSGGNGISVGIQAETVTGCAAVSIGGTGSGVSEGIGANTVSACSVSSVGGPGSASVQYGIESNGTVSDCSVVNVGNSSSSAFMYGIDAQIVSRCRVTSISTTSAIVGISARVISASAVSNLVHLGGSTGGITGITGERVSDCQVDILGANSTAPCVGIFARRAISGSTASGVGNFGTGGSFGLDLGTGCVAEHCHVGGLSTIGIRAVANARITQCEVSGATIVTGIDCQAGGSLVDGNNVFGCTTGIKAVGATLVTRNHVSNSPTKFSVTAACQVGPITNAAGVVAGTISPWANFTD